MPRPDFSFHKLNPNGQIKSSLMAAIFENVCEDLEAQIGPGESRELSLMYTHLEKACFYAKKAMARKPENQANDE